MAVFNESIHEILHPAGSPLTRGTVKSRNNSAGERKSRWDQGLRGRRWWRSIPGGPFEQCRVEQHFRSATPPAEQCAAICHAFQSVLDVPLIGIQMDINISRARSVPARCTDRRGRTPLDAGCSPRRKLPPTTEIARRFSASERSLAIGNTLG